MKRRGTNPPRRDRVCIVRRQQRSGRGLIYRGMLEAEHPTQRRLLEVVVLSRRRKWPYPASRRGPHNATVVACPGHVSPAGNARRSAVVTPPFAANAANFGSPVSIPWGGEKR